MKLKFIVSVGARPKIGRFWPKLKSILVKKELVLTKNRCVFAQNLSVSVDLWCGLGSTDLKTTDRTIGQTNIAVAFDRRKVVGGNET